MTSTELYVRTYEAQDESALTEMVRRAGNFSEQEIVIAAELLGLCAAGNQSDYHTFVAMSERTPAGFVILGKTPATAATFDMYWIVVDPEFQGNGIGHALDQFAIDWVTKQSGRLIIAETSSKESYAATRKFYERQGYQRMAEVKEYYGPNDDLIWYGKRIGTE